MTDYLNLIEQSTGKEIKVPAGTYTTDLDDVAKWYLAKTRSKGALAGHLKTTEENINKWIEERATFRQAVAEGMALGQMGLEDSFVTDSSFAHWEFYMTNVYKVHNKVNCLMIPVESMSPDDVVKMVERVNK
jgi:hypothetical protein